MMHDDVSSVSHAAREFYYLQDMMITAMAD